MAEYIDKEALLTAVKKLDQRTGIAELYTEDVLDLIRDFPEADVAPVRRGKWEGTADGYANGQLVYDNWNCSECGFDADGAEEEPQWKFCPNCGARMDGTQPQREDV